MSYTGTGTQTDPYIVDNWTDFRTCAQRADAYIKWADSDTKFLDMTGQTVNVVPVLAAEIDFNGWTIANITHTKTTGNAEFLFMIIEESQSGNRVFKNGLFSNLYLPDNTYICNHGQSSFVTFDKVHFIAAYENYISISIGGRYSGKDDYGCYFRNCLLMLTSAWKGLNDTGGNAVRTIDTKFENCEIHYNMCVNTMLLMYNAASKCYYRNCYITGDISVVGSQTGGTVYLIGSNSNPQGIYLYLYHTIFNFSFSAPRTVYITGSVEWHDSSEGMCSLFCLDRGSQLTYTYSSIQPTWWADVIKQLFISSENLKSREYISDIMFYNESGSIKRFGITADTGIRNAEFFSSDSETWTFLIDSEVNGGYPFLPFWKYPVSAPPVVVPIGTQPFIRVHDSVSVRESVLHDYDFDSNGIRIIRPLSCTVKEELNGKYICELEHAIDSEGDWLTLQEHNILSVPILYHNEETTQLFRITQKNIIMSQTGEKSVKVTAFHIFYDLMARAILSASVTDLPGYNALHLLFSSVFTFDGKLGGMWYPYQYASDITDTYTSEYKDTNIVEAIMGSDSSLINQLGGELYRDNFYFSVNKEKEHAVTAEPIRYSVNMLEIRVSVDWTNYCNYFRAYDNFGNWNDVSYVDYYGSLGDIVRTAKFNYDAASEEQLAKDMFAYFNKVREPVVNYKVKFADLRNTELYKNFLDLKTAEVGDTVPIINEQLDITTESKVISKEYDVLRRKTISIEVGEQKGSIIRKSFLSDTVFNPSADVRALQKKLGIIT